MTNWEKYKDKIEALDCNFALVKGTRDCFASCGQTECRNCEFDGDTGYKCGTEKIKWAMSEAPKPKRWETIKSDEDLINMLKDAEDFCHESHCDKCRLKLLCEEATIKAKGRANSTIAYLLEEVDE